MFPYLSADVVKEGVSWYGIFLIVLAVAIFGFWFKSFIDLGMKGSNNNKSVVPIVQQGLNNESIKSSGGSTYIPIPTAIAEVKVSRDISRSWLDANKFPNIFDAVFLIVIVLSIKYLWIPRKHILIEIKNELLFKINHARMKYLRRGAE